MKNIVKALMCIAALTLTAPSFADESAPPKKGDTVTGVKCEHGVKRTLCTRCNPKLKAVFKAKKDWCAEHDRPESQCAICHPDLAKEGIKP